MTSLNILNNNIEKTGAELLEGAWKSHKTLKTICGASDELDLSGKQGNDLPVVVVELKNNGAMTILDISNNNLGQRWTNRLGNNNRVDSRNWEADASGK